MICLWVTFTPTYNRTKNCRICCNFYFELTFALLSEIFPDMTNIWGIFTPLYNVTKNCRICCSCYFEICFVLLEIFLNFLNPNDSIFLIKINNIQQAMLLINLNFIISIYLYVCYGGSTSYQFIWLFATSSSFVGGLTFRKHICFQNQIKSLKNITEKKNMLLTE